MAFRFHLPGAADARRQGVRSRAANVVVRQTTQPRDLCSDPSRFGDRPGRSDRPGRGHGRLRCRRTRRWRSIQRTQYRGRLRLRHHFFHGLRTAPDRSARRIRARRVSPDSHQRRGPRLRRPRDYGQRSGGPGIPEGLRHGRGRVHCRTSRVRRSGRPLERPRQSPGHPAGSRTDLGETVPSTSPSWIAPAS